MEFQSCKNFFIFRAVLCRKIYVVTSTLSCKTLIYLPVLISAWRERYCKFGISRSDITQYSIWYVNGKIRRLLKFGKRNALHTHPNPTTTHPPTYGELGWFWLIHLRKRTAGDRECTVQSNSVFFRPKSFYCYNIHGLVSVMSFTAKLLSSKTHKKISSIFSTIYRYWIDDSQQSTFPCDWSQYR